MAWTNIANKIVNSSLISLDSQFNLWVCFVVDECYYPRSRYVWKWAQASEERPELYSR